MQKIIFGLLLGLPLMHCQTVPQTETKPLAFDSTLAAELAEMEELDQIAAYIPQGEYKEWPLEKWQNFKDSVFTSHQNRVQEIFRAKGYPGFNLVGETGEGDFWVMVQHADKNPAFQKEVLDALKIEVDDRNANPNHYGLLMDRYLLNTGDKQRYGTQVMYHQDSCIAMPRPLEDSLRVNERRMELGMEPIEVYLNGMAEMHFRINQAHFETKGISEPTLYPVADQD